MTPPDFGFFTPIGIVTFLTIMTLLVAAHEYGHYLFARMFRMDVEEFAIGFGKKPLFTWLKRGDTVFTVRPWPLGGFVRIRGMVPEEDGSEVHVTNGFYSKSPFARFMVLFAGPLFSFLAGWVLLLGLYTAVGVSKPSPEPVVGGVAPNMPAAKAGLKEGDRLVSIDGRAVTGFYDVLSYVRDRANQPIRLAYERSGEQREVVVTPVLETRPSPIIGPNLEITPETRIQGKLGMAWSEKQEFGFPVAWRASFETMGLVFVQLQRIFSSFQVFRENVGGPITMADASSRAANYGLDDVVGLAALLSISLGVFNLLPVPPLDGGQMTVALIEMFRRGRRLSFRVQNWIATAGFGVLLIFFVFVFANDIGRLANRTAPETAPETKAEAPTR